MRALIALAFALAIALPASAVAQSQRITKFVEGPVVKAPFGWLRFCEDYPSDKDCTATSIPASHVQKVTLSSQRLRDLREVNRQVNREIKDIEDIDHWGTADERYVIRDKFGKVLTVNKWTLGEDGKGDCAVKVLVKRKRLIARGWNPQSLRITFAWNFVRKGGKTIRESHVVLGVPTDIGNFILDNLTDEIKKSEQTPYDYLGWQSGWNPNHWVRFLRPEEALARAN